MKMRVSLKLLFFIIAISCYGVVGQVQLTDASPSVTIDFSTTVTGVNNGAFLGTGFTATPAVGQLDSDAWETTGFGTNVAYGATVIAGDAARGDTATGGVGTGGIYSFTGALAGNASLMVQPGGSDFAPGTITLRVQNTDLSKTMNQLTLAYDLFVNNDQGRSNSFNFSYSTDDATYTPVGALDYTSPVATDALGFVTTPNAPLRSTTISGITVGPSAFLYLRWTGNDVGGSGSRDEFALDNIDMTGRFIVTTAAPGTIQGRARFANGRGIKHSVVMLTGGALNEPIYATTNQFGYYQFQDVSVGQSYVMQITSRRYTFLDSSRVINLEDSITNEDFIVNEPSKKTIPNKKDGSFNQKESKRRP